MAQPIIAHILDSKAANRPLLAMLLDPEKAKIDHLPITKQVQPDMLFVGGSTGGDTTEFVRSLRKKMQQLEINIPIVLFPGNAKQFTPEADALLYLSLLSGRNPEMLVGQQVEAAQNVKKSGIETIPMGYILIDGGVNTSVMRASNTAPIPRDDVHTILSTAIAAELMGKKLIYLEAGSGAKMPISSEIIAAVRENVSIPIIVGGGIRNPQQMNAAYKAGADIVVIGNHFESNPDDLALFTMPQPALSFAADDERFMSLALMEAQKALEQGEVPIGCVIVSQNQIIGRGHNLTEMLQDVTAHAEIQAITAATQTIGGKYLPEATLYVTVEPCTMCAGAIGWAQIKRIVYGAPDPKRGYTQLAPHAFHPKAQVTRGVLEKECKQLIQHFFAQKRIK
jgi:phosphoglycerol geranylgeranyltransferase